jgi:hypothetical protein
MPMPRDEEGRSGTLALPNEERSFSEATRALLLERFLPLGDREAKVMKTFRLKWERFASAATHERQIRSDTSSGRRGAGSARTAARSDETTLPKSQCIFDTKFIETMNAKKLKTNHERDGAMQYLSRIVCEIRRTWSSRETRLRSAPAA